MNLEVFNYFFRETPNGVFIILAALISVLGVLTINRIKSYRESADEFRKAILNEVHGAIPNSGAWSQDECVIVKNSTTAVKKASMIFEPHVPFYYKSAFKKTVEEYCKEASKFGGRKNILDALYPSDSEEPKRDVIIKHFERLLHYSK